MKYKIYRNKEVLRGIKFKAKLKNKFYDFKIFSVSTEGITISKSMNYDKINYANPDSFESCVKEVILDNAVDNNLAFSKKAFMSAIKLKKIPIIFDGYRFNFEQITNSGVLVIFFIGLDELMKNEENDFVGTIKNVVLDNMSDDPQKIVKRRPYRRHDYSSFWFDFGWSIPVDVSDRIVEKNREKYKKQREEEKRKREKGKELDKMLNLDKKSKTRELARFR